MNYRMLLSIAVAILVAQGNAFAARSSKKRVARSSQAPMEIPSQNKGASNAVSDPEQVRYDQAKAKAKEDPEVKALKTKADQATGDNDARETSVAYNRTLFRKMKQLDRSISDRADLVEAAIIRRINAASIQ